MKPDRTIFLTLFVLILSLFTYSQPVINKGIDITGFSTEYYSIPFIDLDNDVNNQVVVDREPGQYLGHPTTVLLEDGKTIYCAYPKGHGRGAIVLKRSDDGGKTWSERLPVPDNWATSQEVPTLYPVVDSLDKKRVIMFSGLYPIRMAVSENNCKTWSELKPAGDWGGIVAMSDLIELKTGKGHYMAMFHDDGRFISKDGRNEQDKKLASAGMPLFKLMKTFSRDGGLTWSYPEPVFQSGIIHLCEPGIVRSPDGKQIAVLLRENSRRMNSFILFSNDEGSTWTPPRELPNSLTGDRHQAVYLADGRLFVSFRDNSPGISRFQQLKKNCTNCAESILKQQAGPVSPTHGDWVAWIGTYDDLVNNREGQYRIRLKDNTSGADCAYPALELLPDGYVIATTYGHWTEGEQPYILSVKIDIKRIK